MYDRAAGLHLKCPTWGSATFLSHRSLNERKIKNSDETILCSICFRRTRIKLIRNNMNDECTEHNEELWTIYPRQKKNRVTFVLPCVKWNIWIVLTVLSTTIDYNRRAYVESIEDLVDDVMEHCQAVRARYTHSHTHLAFWSDLQLEAVAN